MSDNEKRKIVIIILTSIIVILFLAIIYALYDKGFIFEKVKNNNKKVEEKKNTVELLYGQEKNMLIERIKEINMFSKYYPFEDVNKIDNQEVLYKIIYDLGYGKPISEKAVSDKVKYLFGNSYNLKHENLICKVDNNSLYIYDSERKLYMYDTNSLHGHGSSGDVRDIVVKYIKGINESDKKITIDTKLVYAAYCGDTCGPNFAYYKSYEDSYNNQNPILGSTTGEDEIELTDKLYKSIEDKLPITTFTFIKKDANTYNLDSVKIKN